MAHVGLGCSQVAIEESTRGARLQSVRLVHQCDATPTQLERLEEKTLAEAIVGPRRHLVHRLGAEHSISLAHHTGDLRTSAATRDRARSRGTWRAACAPRPQGCIRVRASTWPLSSGCTDASSRRAPELGERACLGLFSFGRGSGRRGGGGGARLLPLLQH